MNIHAKILVVDDDPAILTATQRVLKQAGYKTFGAQDGEVALQMTYTQHPDLVLLDVNLPDIDGFEVCRQIKTDLALAGTFVILLYNASDGDSKADGLNMGADDYIPRPISNRELLARVQATLRIQIVERALQVSDAQWSATFDAVGDAIFLTDANDTILKSNRAAAEMWQCSLDALIGKNCYEVVYGTEATVSACPLVKVRETKCREVITFARNERYLEARVDPMFAANGNFTGTVHVITDITERKHAEQALHDSEYFFKESQRAAFIGSYKTNFVTGFWESSEVLDQIFGIDQNYGRSIQGWLEIIHPDDRKMMGRYLREDVITNHTRFNRNYRIIRKSDGQIRWVHGLGEVAFDHEGNIISMIGTIQDITERKHAEEALHEREKRFRALIENSSDAITLLDANGIAVYDSPAAPGMLGYASSDWIGRDVFALVHPDDLHEVQGSFQNIVKTPGAHVNSTFRVQHKSGSWLWIETVATNLLYEPGVHAIVLNYRDITERKQAEVTLRESQESYRLLVETLPDGVVVHSQGRIVFANQASATTVGASNPANFIGQPVIEFVHPDFRERALKRILQSLDDGVAVPFEEEKFVRLDGTSIDVEVSATPLSYAGKPAMLTVFNDITERKKIEEALRESEQRLRKFYDSSLVGVIYWNMHGQITDANNKFLEMSGYTRAELVAGQIDWGNMTPPEYRYLDDASTAELKATGINKTPFEKVYIRKDGTRMPIILAGAMLDEARFNGVAFVLDVTERRQAEEALKEYNTRLETAVEARTRELREAQEQLVRQEKLAVLGQLAGGVGHELRNPLGIINNAIYYLRMVQPDADAKVREYLGIIETEAHNADKIISDLLDFSRIKSVDVEPVAVSGLVERTLERFPAPGNVRVILNLPENLPDVYIDLRQVTQVLGNLVLNACQSMTSAGSTATISKVGKLTLSAKKKGKLVAIAVADTGVGISPENMKRLFEPLFTTKPKGIGLGLAVSKKLAEANGGRIEAQSESGQGSTFTLYLPVTGPMELL